MVIIIDGYNFLRSVFDRHMGRLEDERALLIKKLGFYFEIKKETVRELLLVFDGGRSPHSEREVKKRIIIYFSGTRFSADEVIIEQAKKRMGEDILLVTHDRALIAQVVALNKKTVSMEAELFWHVIHQVSVEQKGALSAGIEGDVIKYKQEEDELLPSKPTELDALMEAMVLSHHKEEKNDFNDDQKRVAKNKKSKKEKTLESVIRKL
jgi:predicted RNA-binding protein with PIN domain